MLFKEHLLLNTCAKFDFNIFKTTEFGRFECQKGPLFTLLFTVITAFSPFSYFAIFGQFESALGSFQALDEKLTLKRTSHH